MPEAVLCELPVNRNLLNPRFEGYKLSIEDLPVKRMTIASGMREVASKPDLFSLQYFKLFTPFNALFLDPWFPETIYYVNSKQQIIVQNPNDSTEEIALYQLPGNSPNLFHISLSFPDDRHVVFSEGHGSVLISTTLEPRNVCWRQHWVPQKSNYQNHQDFRILDSKIRANDLSDILEVVIVFVDEIKGENEEGDRVKMENITVMEWITFAYDENEEIWMVQGTRRFQSECAPFYVAIEAEGAGLSIAGEKSWTLVADSFRPLLQDDAVMENATVNSDKLLSEEDKGSMPEEEVVSEEMKETMARLAANAPEYCEMDAGNPGQLEECDQLPEDGACWLQYDVATQTFSQKVDLSSHQLLFCAILDPKELPTLCLRRDVDGLLFRPLKPTGRSPLDAAPLEHIGTFDALGYVMASKREQLFASCSSDMSFVAICDSRSVFIYRGQVAVESTLKNRKTGRVVNTISRQHVVTLEGGLPILGLAVTKAGVFVLRKDALYFISV